MAVDYIGIKYDNEVLYPVGLKGGTVGCLLRGWGKGEERERERERLFNRAQVYLFFTLDEIVLLRGSRFHVRLWKNLELLLPCPSVNRTALLVKSF